MILIEFNFQYCQIYKMLRIFLQIVVFTIKSVFQNVILQFLRTYMSSQKITGIKSGSVSKFCYINDSEIFFKISCHGSWLFSQGDCNFLQTGLIFCIRVAWRRKILNKVQILTLANYLNSDSFIIFLGYKHRFSWILSLYMRQLRFRITK